jgi:tetratricopeptide (TPR) repeat protein
MMDTKRDEIHIGNVGSDVIGSAISGRGNIIGKEVAYSVSGNVVNLHIESISTQTLQELTNIISQPLQADNSDVELDKARANEAKVNKEETNQVLKDIDQIAKEKGTHIEHIRAGAFQVSRTELILRDAILEGNEHYYRGEYSEAIEHFDSALEIDNKNSKAWINKGLALHSLGKYDEAIRCYDKTLEIDSENAKSWYNKGNALRNLGKHGEAIKSHDKSLEMGRKHLHLYVSNNINKGINFGIIGMYEEAIKCFDSALKIERRDADAWMNKGFALSNLHKYSEAIRCYDMALKIDSKQATTWYNKGNALRALGKNKEAEECFAKARKLA